MKNIFKYLFIFMAFSCKSQVTSIAPLNGLRFEQPNGTYFKDLNNELDYYVGRWEGISNNKKYIFEFVKFTQHLNDLSLHESNYYYRDELQGKFKVIDLTTNQVLYDNLSIFNYDDYLISGIVKKNKSFSFMYLDPEKCNLEAEFYLMQRTDLPNNQLKYCCFSLKSYGSLMGCPTYSDIHQIPIFLPKEDLILAKQ